MQATVGLGIRELWFQAGVTGLLDSENNHRSQYLVAVVAVAMVLVRVVIGGVSGGGHGADAGCNGGYGGGAGQIKARACNSVLLATKINLLGNASRLRGLLLRMDCRFSFNALLKGGGFKPFKARDSVSTQAFWTRSQVISP